jgi:hypothetical protein
MRAYDSGRLNAGDGIKEPPCPVCGGELVFHQADVNQPGRPLAVCLACKSWFLTTTLLAHLFRLPDEV